MFNSRDDHSIRFDLSTVEKVLSDGKLVVKIPNYISGRPTNMNVSIIKTGLWIWSKNIMEPKDIHECLIAFEIMCKQLKSDSMPLSEKIVDESLRSIGKVIPKSLFIMWCKKCWQFLDCAKIFGEQGNGGKVQEEEKKAAGGKKSMLNDSGISDLD